MSQPESNTFRFSRHLFGHTQATANRCAFPGVLWRIIGHNLEKTPALAPAHPIPPRVEKRVEVRRWWVRLGCQSWGWKGDRCLADLQSFFRGHETIGLEGCRKGRCWRVERQHFSSTLLRSKFRRFENSSGVFAERSARHRTGIRWLS